MPDARAALASDDPTGSKTKQEAAIGELNSRWKRVRGEIRDLLENEDRLKPGSDTRQSVKIADFEDELEGIIEEEVIEPLGSRDVRRGRHYSSQWTDSAYQHGLDLADEHLKRAGYDPPDTETEEAIREDHHQDAIETQRLRTYDDLEEAGRNAEEDASRRYAEGIAAGVGLSALIRNSTASEVADQGVNDRIDKRGQTGTRRALSWHYVETINDAALNRYTVAGVDEVTGAIESEIDIELEEVDADDLEDAIAIQTAEDDRVCNRCLRIAAEGPYPIEDVREDPELRPPYHISCRCVAIPAPIQARTNVLFERPVR